MAELTSSASGVLLDSPALPDEGVLGALPGRAGEAALDGRADSGGAQLGGEAGSQAEHLALGKHLQLVSGEVPELPCGVEAQLLVRVLFRDCFEAGCGV